MGTEDVVKTYYKSLVYQNSKYRQNVMNIYERSEARMAAEMFQERSNKRSKIEFANHFP